MMDTFPFGLYIFKDRPKYMVRTKLKKSIKTGFSDCIRYQKLFMITFFKVELRIRSNGILY
jgi:hypothetical protein